MQRAPAKPKHDINLSRFLEKRFFEAVREANEKNWREKNREAITEYNELVAKRSSFGDRHRRF